MLYDRGQFHVLNLSVVFFLLYYHVFHHAMYFYTWLLLNVLVAIYVFFI